MSLNGENGRQTRSERQVLDALREQLLPGEQLLENVRFTDDRGGDIEIDALLLLPGLGAAVIEIKGGLVEYRNGEWTTTTATSRRRIRPTEQARKGKHALRAFLARQDMWVHGLLRTEWFIAMPFTPVDGDMGPEGLRALLIGEADVERAMDMVRTRLRNVEDGCAVPTESDVELAHALLQSQSGMPRRSRSAHVFQLGLFAVLGVVLTAVCFVAAEVANQSSAFWLAALLAMAMVVGAGSLFRRKFAHFTRDLVVAGVIAFLLGWLVGIPIANSAPLKTLRGCQPNYGGCLPLVDDLDCSQIVGQVQVTGEDVYRLDRDKDGIGCEWNEPPKAP